MALSPEALTHTAAESNGGAALQGIKDDPPGYEKTLELVFIPVCRHLLNFLHFCTF